MPRSLLQLHCAIIAASAQQAAQQAAQQEKLRADTWASYLRSLGVNPEAMG